MSSREAVNTNFNVIGLTRLGIKPKSTAQETDAPYHSAIWAVNKYRYKTSWTINKLIDWLRKSNKLNLLQLTILPYWQNFPHRIFEISFKHDWFLISSFLSSCHEKATEALCFVTDPDSLRRRIIQGRNNETWVGVEPSTLRLWLSWKRCSEPLLHAADIWLFTADIYSTLLTSIYSTLPLPTCAFILN